MNRLTDRLKICAEAHGLRWNDFTANNKYDPPCFVIMGCNIPTLSDVRSIVRGFTGSEDAVESEWSWDMIVVDYTEVRFLPERDIDWRMINMALPYNYAAV